MTRDEAHKLYIETFIGLVTHGGMNYNVNGNSTKCRVRVMHAGLSHSRPFYRNCVIDAAYVLACVLQMQSRQYLSPLLTKDLLYVTGFLHVHPASGQYTIL